MRSAVNTCCLALTTLMLWSAVQSLQGRERSPAKEGRGERAAAAERVKDADKGEKQLGAEKAGPDKRKEALAKSAAEKKGPASLSAETIATATEWCPDLLKLRQAVDELYKEYETLGLTMGRQERKDAMRQLPGVGRDLEKTLAKLKKLHDKMIDPLDQERDKLEEKERRLFDVIGRLEDQGKDATKERKEADALNEKQRVLDVRLDVVSELGSPGLEIEDPDDMLLGYLIRPGELQQRSFDGIVKHYPDLVEGRVYLAHIEAESAALHKEKGAGNSKDVDDELAKLERQKKGVEKKFRKLFLDVREEYVERVKEAREEKAKIMPKVDRERERGKSGKYEQMLSRFESQLEGAERDLSVVDLFVKNTEVVTKEELRDMLDGKEGKQADR